MDKKMVLWIVIVILVIAGFVFINVNNKNNMNTDDTKNSLALGDTAGLGDMVSVNYTGKLSDGTIFDSNVDPKFKHVKPFQFVLGAGQVIPGWDKGIAGMKVGEKKILVIPPEDAYGKDGIGPIPPNATLTFDVELLAINHPTEKK